MGPIVLTFLGFCLLGQTSFAAISEIKSDESHHVCRQIYVSDDVKGFFASDVFNKNERLLICGGDPKGWKPPPLKQAISWLKRFLEDRGYYSPTVNYSDGKVFVITGSPVRITELRYEGSPEGFFLGTFIGVNGQLLTSDSLDRVEQWTQSRMATLGYPCPDITIEAVVETGVVSILVKPGPKVRIMSVDRTDANGIDPRAVSRYDAFAVGQFYDGLLLDLTSRRVMDDGLADFVAFKNRCFSKKFVEGHLTQEFSQSHHRSVKVVLGASTQEFPIAKLQWNLFRLDKMASQNRVQLYLSNRELSVEERLQWYPVPSWPRLSLVPEAKVSRLSEDFFESVTQKYSLGFQYTADDSVHNYGFLLAPTFRNESTIRGDAADTVAFLSLEAEMALMSHLFEYYATSPRTGYQFQVSWWGRREGLGSSQSGDRFRLDGTWLTNFGAFDPPVVVLGLRFQMEQLITEGLVNTPPSLRLYLGGDNSLRGFNRKQINNGGLGFNQTYYIGLESRFTKVLPLQIQPLAFVDVAQAFAEDTRFDRVFFWSPGFGLRWASPFGAVRSTLGYGMVEGDTRAQPPEVSEQWTFFVSLGQEF